MDWTDYPNFTEAEFLCKHTGRCDMQPEFMARLQRLRAIYGKPMIVTSGYRDPSHPAEARKSKSGAHAKGRAVDIAVTGADALRIIEVAQLLRFTGIGVQQKGGGRFIHLDDCETERDGIARPAIWSY